MFCLSEFLFSFVCIVRTDFGDDVAAKKRTVVIILVAVIVVKVVKVVKVRVLFFSLLKSDVFLSAFKF